MHRAKGGRRDRRRPPLPSLLLWAAGGFLLMLMAAVLLWPAPVDRPLYGSLLRTLRRLRGHGLPQWLDYAALEVLANVLFFVPLGVIAAVLLTRKQWWLAPLVCSAVSAGMELVQALFLVNRQGNLQDVALNSIGALLGAVIAAMARKAYRRRHPAGTTVR